MLNLTQRTRELLAQNKVELQLIVEVDGVDFIFGATPVKSLWRIGDANIRIGDSGLFIGGIVTNPNSKALIDATQSTRTISQQLELERGVSSVSSIKIRVMDEGDVATEAFSPAPSMDILGRGCAVYIGITGGAHPEDSIRVFDGMIDDCTFGPGYCDLNIAHPEQFKRQAILPKYESELVTPITSTTSAPETLQVGGLENLVMFNGLDGAITYLRINDEILRYQATGGSNTFLNPVSRGEFTTVPATHSAGDKVQSFYYFERNPIELALMLMCSTLAGESEYYVEGLKVANISQVFGQDYTHQIDIETQDVLKYNLQVGDTLHLVESGATVASLLIQRIDTSDGVGRIFTGSPGSIDTGKAYEVSAISKWNILPIGCAIPNRYIDFDGFDVIRITHASELTSAKVFVKDTISDAKEFIDQILLRPQGLYTLPRQGRISIGKTVPPVANKETKILNERNILNAGTLRISRSINRNFYNSVTYKYEEDAIEDKLLHGDITIDVNSLSKVRVGSRPLLIEAKSLRKGPETTKVIRSQSKRLMDRYRYGAEVIKVDVDFETGVNVDVGDTAVCQFKNLKVADITSRSRNFAPRLMEITNKSLSVASGAISLELTNTVFEVDGRYGTITPSSRIASGSSATVIRLGRSFSRWAEGNEKGKWEQYIDQKIMLRSSDWAQIHHSTIKALDTSQDAIIIEPLGVTPSADWIVEAPLYDDTYALEMSFWKQVHAFINPAVMISSVTSSTVIHVGSGEGAKFLSGAVIVVHSADFSSKSSEVKILSVSGDQLTLESALSYTPSAGHLIQLIGFKDGGHPYRIV